jgi:hypothetical protein
MSKEIEFEGVPDEVNDILSGFQRLSAITQLLSDINNLSRWINKRCGNCDKWMCSNLCPREKNVNGRNHGPSMNTLGCDLFSLKSYQIKYYNRECQELLDSKYMKFIPEGKRPKLLTLEVA